MPSEENLSLRRSKRTGLWICAGSLVVGFFFLAGIMEASYWALALPVAVAVFSVLSLSFWIGYTINTVQGIPPEADHYEGRQARRIALAICAGSVLLALLFGVGILRESYWALALPVAVGVLGMAAMVFWIGWAIFTQRSTLDEHDSRQGEESPGEGE